MCAVADSTTRQTFVRDLQTLSLLDVVAGVGGRWKASPGANSQSLVQQTGKRPLLCLLRPPPPPAPPFLIHLSFPCLPPAPPPSWVLPSPFACPAAPPLHSSWLTLSQSPETSFQRGNSCGRIAAPSPPRSPPPRAPNATQHFPSRVRGSHSPRPLVWGNSLSLSKGEAEGGTRPCSQRHPHVPLPHPVVVSSSRVSVLPISPHRSHDRTVTMGEDGAVGQDLGAEAEGTATVGDLTMGRARESSRWK